MQWAGTGAKKEQNAMEWNGERLAEVLPPSLGEGNE